LFIPAPPLLRCLRQILYMAEYLDRRRNPGSG
jgi:hypothetical protein